MSNNKKIIIASVIVFTVFAYMSVSQKETQAQATLVTPDTTALGVGGGYKTDQKGREILDLLADLKKIQLDESIFSDPMFRLLQDTSVELVLEPKGRPNPFAPLGKDAIFDENATIGMSDTLSKSAVGTKSKTTNAKGAPTGGTASLGQ